MKPPNLWRFITAAIPAFVALALCGTSGSAAAQSQVVEIKPVPLYGCAKSKATIIRKNELRIPGTNTFRFQGGGSTNPAPGFIPVKGFFLDRFGDGRELHVEVDLVPEQTVDPVRGPINCFELDLPISEGSTKISFNTRLYASEPYNRSAPIAIETANLFIGPHPIRFNASNDCVKSEPTIIPQGKLMIPGINKILFQGGGDSQGTYPLAVTLEERGDLLIVNAKVARQGVFGVAINCFIVDLPISSTARQLQFIAELYEADRDQLPTGNVLKSGQTSLLLIPVTTPAPTLSFWALLALAIGACWVGYRRLQAKRINAAHSSTSFALLALSLSLLAPPRPMHKTSPSPRQVKKQRNR